MYVSLGGRSRFGSHQGRDANGNIGIDEDFQAKCIEKRAKNRSKGLPTLMGGGKQEM